MPDSPPTSSFLSPPAPPKPRSKRRWPLILLWSGCGLFVLLALAPLAAVLWLRSAAKAALPQLDGDVHLAGLSAPVTVRRDAHGVPHIEAATQDDLFVAQGYVTAQDRLWQMDAFRRNANGELAEILGVIEKARVNIEYLYGFTLKEEHKGLLAFRFDDPDKAIAILKKHRLNPVRNVDLFERLAR